MAKTPLTVLITGANRGIGLELVRQYAARGDNVIATCRDPGAASELATLANSSGRVEVHRLAVDRTADSERLAAKLAGRVLDVLINNAGKLDGRGAIDASGNGDESWRDVLMTNIAGPFFVTRALLPLLRKSKAARVIVTSSSMASSQNAMGGTYAYRASKAGVTNLARNLAVELRSEGIAVAAIDPGWVSTDMGGSDADITAEVSARGFMAEIDRLSIETTGAFITYSGATQPF